MLKFLKLPKRPKRPLLALGAVTLLLAVGVGFFFAGRMLVGGDDAAKAEPPPTPSPERIAEIQAEIPVFHELLEEEFEKSKFTGVVNGIRIVADAAEIENRCSELGVRAKYVPIEAARGTALDIVPSYLPEVSVEFTESAAATACAGEVVVFSRTFSYNPDGVSRGDFGIARFQGEHAVSVETSAGRLEAATIRGYPALLIHTVGTSLQGPGTVVVAEEFGVTIVHGFGVPLEELIKVAEGLQ